jgi:predicted DNA-binding WGR domain protein
MREWGRIGSRGQVRVAPFPTPQDAQAALDRQRRMKERRGYELEVRGAKTGANGPR